MKTALLLAACLAAAIIPGAASAATPFYLKNGDRVVMYGDSITEEKLYSLYTEEFIVTRFPKLRIDWINAGWYGDRVIGGNGGTADVRIQRDVLPYKPTVVTIMLGMNDGLYRPFDQTLYDTYTAGYAHIYDTIKKEAPSAKFTLIQPSPYDDLTQPPKFAGGYNSVLLRYGDFVKTFGAQTGQAVTDFNTPVLALLRQTIVSDAALAPAVLPDRVHPARGGHLLMAEALLKTWNAPSVVSAVAIDSSKKIIAYMDNAIASNLSVGSTVTWDQTDGALPMPFDTTDPTASFVVNNSDFVSTLDQQTVQVTRLPAAKYVLKIDSKPIATFTSKQLGAGVNLATLETPMLAQAQHVAELAQYHSDMQYRRWRSIQVPLETEPDPGVQTATKAMIAALNIREAAIVASMHAAALPTLHHYSLTPAP